MAACSHIGEIRDVTPSAQGCEDCLRIGAPWVHLRECLICGHVGCCDSSPNRHATKHFHATGHPIVRSFEPGEDWLWCYADEVIIEPRNLVQARSPHHPMRSGIIEPATPAEEPHVRQRQRK